MNVSAVKSVELDKLRQNCPTCGSLNEASSIACGVCGTPLAVKTVPGSKVVDAGREHSIRGGLKVFAGKFKTRPVAVGALWGLVQAALFWIPLAILAYVPSETIANSLGPLVPAYFVATIVVVPFFLGFYLRDLEASLRAFVSSQLAVWAITFMVVWAISAPTRSFFDSNFSYSTQQALTFLIGWTILSFILGLLMCLCGSFVKVRMRQ